MEDVTYSSSWRCHLTATEASTTMRDPARAPIVGRALAPLEGMATSLFACCTCRMHQLVSCAWRNDTLPASHANECDESLPTRHLFSSRPWPAMLLLTWLKHTRRHLLLLALHIGWRQQRLHILLLDANRTWANVVGAQASLFQPAF